MEPIGVVRASPSEVSKRGSDALTFVLMQEKEKAKANKDSTPERPVKRFHSLLKSRSKLKKNSSTETSKFSLGNNTRDISPPISRSRSTPDRVDVQDVSLFSSPGATSIETSFGSPESDLHVQQAELEETLIKEAGTRKNQKEEASTRKKEEKAKLKYTQKQAGGTGFMKNLLRRNNNNKRAKKGFKDAESVISRDLDLLSINSAGTKTIRHRNTGRRRESDSEEPREMRKRATRYKKRAMKLMSEITDGGDDDGPGKDSKDIESIARKAYKYAAESRRLFDLAAEREKLLSMTAIQSPPRLTNISEMSVSTRKSSAEQSKSSKPKDTSKKSTHRRAASCGDLAPASEIKRENSIMEETVASCNTTFTHEVELEEHLRKMKELELFTKKDLLESTLTCGGQEYDLAPEYKAETERIIDTMEKKKSTDETDIMSVMTSTSCVSQETSASEIEVRLKHKSKMNELELWDANAMWDSVLETFNLKSVEEEPKLEEEEEEDNKSEDKKTFFETKTVAPGRTVTTVSVLTDDSQGEENKNKKVKDVISVIENVKISEPMQKKFASMKKKQKSLQTKVEKHVEAMQLDNVCSTGNDIASQVQNAIVDGSPCRAQMAVDSDSESCSGSDSDSCFGSDDDSDCSDSGSESSCDFSSDSEEEKEDLPPIEVLARWINSL
mmetsp:Transcript_10782/g.16548  ORF Transcript_10782/g.16548 Transcript_10782/m.16548 type:complete len:670 (+) Transcript_10782:81-2090(+)